MRFAENAVLALVTLSVLLGCSSIGVDAKRSKSSSAASSSSARRASVSGSGSKAASARGSSSSSSGRKSSKRPPVSKRRYEVEFEEEDDLIDDFPRSEILSNEYDELEEDILVADEDEDIMDDYDEEFRRPKPRSKRPPPKRSSRQQAQQQPPRNKRPPPSRRFEEDEFMDEEDDFEYDRPQRSTRRPPPQGRDRLPPPRRGGPHPRRGAVVPYGKQRMVKPQPTAFTRGITALKNSVPDTAAIREKAASSISAARSSTSNLSTNLYREVKGLASSELEQVMLKATRPDDEPVKAKHVERLVKISYQVNSRFDIYESVLRKLWKKMSEKDWRTTIKALYIMHCFSADGSPEHAPALKARLRELRRTHDPKLKEKYFSTKLILGTDKNLENAPFRDFLARYAHYVMLRAQCFSGIFTEISNPTKIIPTNDKRRAAAMAEAAAKKPITSTSLRVENLDAASLIFRSAIKCQLRDGEDCPNTATALERVVSDMIGLSAAVAVALNRALVKDEGMENADTELICKWCEFYSKELLPQTRSMVKRMSPRLDEFGIYLPSRMGTTVSPDVLKRGMNLSSKKAEESEEEAMEEEAQPVGVEEKEESPEPVKPKPTPTPAIDEEEYDEYEYDEEEYYDDEEPF